MSTPYFLEKIKNNFQVSENKSDFRRDYDTPWKSILHLYFKECVDFFFPNIAEAINWNMPVEFCDGELQKIAMDGETGRRLVDVLVKVCLKKETYVAFFLHVEVQGAGVEKFAERIFIYYSRIFDRYRLPVMTLAILTDNDASWRPNVYEFSIFGFEHSLKFPIVKLLDYRNQRDFLEQSENPFALVVLAHLEALRTKKDYVAGLQAKIALTRHLYTLSKKQGKPKEFVRHLFNTIDFLLALPPASALEYQKSLHTLEQEVNMAYISSIEHLALQQGIQQGRQQGIEQGIEQGMYAGRKQERQNIVRNLKNAGMSTEDIAKVTGLPLSELSVERS